MYEFICESCEVSRNNCSSEDMPLQIPILLLFISLNKVLTVIFKATTGFNLLEKKRLSAATYISNTQNDI